MPTCRREIVGNRKRNVHLTCTVQKTTMALSNCRIVRPREDPPHPSRTPGKSPDARTYGQCPMRSTRRVRMRGKFLRRGNFHRTTGRNSGLSPLRVGNKRTRKTEIMVQPARKRQVLVQNDPHKEHNENNTSLGNKTHANFAHVIISKSKARFLRRPLSKRSKFRGHCLKVNQEPL